MSDRSNIAHADQHVHNPLAVPLVDTLRIARARAEEIRSLRQALSAAMELLCGRDRKLDAAREQRDHLRAQVRALMTGRTLAEQRQAEERATTDAQERAA